MNSDILRHHSDKGARPCPLFPVLVNMSSALLLLGLCLGPVLGAQDCPSLDVTNVWADGLESDLTFTLDHATHGWELNLKYDRKIARLDCWTATVETQDLQTFRLTSLGWDDDHEAGHEIRHHLTVWFTSRPFLIHADIDGQDVCGFAPSTTAKPTTTTTTVPATTTSEPTTTTPEENECADVVKIEETDGPTTIVEVHLIPTMPVSEWVVELQFKEPIKDIIAFNADVSGAGTGWKLSSRPGEGSIQPGGRVEVKCVVQHGAPSMPGIRGVSFNGRTVCGNVASP